AVERANPTAGGGLRVAAPSAARRGLLGPRRDLGGLRRQPLPAARREIPRSPERCDLPGLPQGTVDAGLLGVRGRVEARFRLRAYTGRTGQDGHALRRVQRLRG